MSCKQKRCKSPGMLKVSRHITDVEYLSFINEHGFGNIEIRPGLSEEDPQKGLMAIIARK